MGRRRSNQKTIEAAVKTLAEMFARNGCLRLPDSKRRKLEKQKYHAGYEIRLVAEDKIELDLTRACLQTVEIDPGREFAKGNKVVFPIYGKDKVERFCSLLKGFLPESVVARKIQR